MDPHFHGVIFQPSAEEIARRLSRDYPPLVILDVRQLSNFIDGRLPGAVPTTNGLAAGVEVLVVGANAGDPRVRPASRELLAGGHRVSELAGGMHAWQTLKLPLERGAFDGHAMRSKAAAGPGGNGAGAVDRSGVATDRDATASSQPAPSEERQTEPASAGMQTPQESTPPPFDLQPVAQRKRVLFWDVDTQVDFMYPDGKLYVPEAETLIDNLARLSRLADDQGLPVLASADDHEPDDAEISDDPDFETTYPPHCMRGTEGARRVDVTQRSWTAEIGHQPLAYEQLKDAAKVSQPQILVHKKRFDVFTNPNVEPLVKALDPGRIIIYGVALDVCNKAAVEGLLERGYTNLTVVTDATKPIRKEVEGELLQIWKDRGVTLATTQEVVQDLWPTES